MIETFQFCYNSAVLVFTFISDLTNFKVLFIIHCKKVSYIYLYHDLLAQSLRIVNFAIILIESCVVEGNTSGPYIPYPGIIPGCYLDQFQMINSRADSNADNYMIWRHREQFCLNNSILSIS